MPFGTPSYSRTAAQQDTIDRALQAATSEAGRGVGMIVRLGKVLLDNSENEESELQAIIMPRVQGALPDAKPRIHLSYSMHTTCSMHIICLNYMHCDYRFKLYI